MVSNKQNSRQRRQAIGEESSEQLQIVKIGILVPLAAGQKGNTSLDNQVQAAIQTFREQQKWIQTQEIRQVLPCWVPVLFYNFINIKNLYRRYCIRKPASGLLIASVFVVLPLE
jgi:hypothetical protein